MTELEGARPSEGCSASTHAWFKEVYDQVRQMAYDLKLEELHEVARKLEDVHEVVHPRVEVRLSVPRGPDERARMSAFVDEVFGARPGWSENAHTHREALPPLLSSDDDESWVEGSTRVVEGSPNDLSGETST